MAKVELEVRSAYLKTNEKIPDRFLFCGKIENGNDKGRFFFYLIEILSPWFPSSKVQKVIIGILEKSILLKNGAPDKSFEDIVSKINEALAKMSENGERDWVGNLNAVIGLVNQTDIIITQTGTISGYIFRKGKISSITEKSTLNPVAAFEDITSGKITQDDRIIFANAELYNHFSLDHLRRTCENKSAVLINHDLFKALRRVKVPGVNAIVLEANCTKETEPSEIPDTLFLDDPEESVVSIIKKRLSPYTQKASEQTKALAMKITSQGKSVWNKGREEWEKKYSPKGRKLFSSKNSGYLRKSDAGRIELKKNDEIIKESKSKTKVKTFSYLNKTSTKVPDLSSFAAKIKEFFTGLLNLKKERSKKCLYIAVILFLVFIGFVKIRANNSDRAKKIQVEEVANSYDEAVKTFALAKEDIGLGKDTAAGELESAMSLAVKASADKDNESKAKTLTTEIQKTADALNKTTRFTNLEPIFSLGEKTIVVVLAGSEIYGINEEGKIYAADPREKESKLVASIGKDNGLPVSLTYSKTPNKIFIYTDKNKVLSYEVNSKTYSELKIVDDSGKWEDAKSMVSFVTNLYLLDSEAGEIWKHVERTGGYSRGTGYANTSQKAIRGAVDAAIDGDLYVLLSDGTVAKFNKTVYDANFSLKPIPAPSSTIESPAQLYTDPDSTDLFILDKKLNRIVRFNKVGDFVGQYAFDNLQIERFILNAKLQKLWVLSADKIYEINL